MQHMVAFNDERWSILKRVAESIGCNTSEFVDHAIRCYFIVREMEEIWPDYVPPGRPTKLPVDAERCVCAAAQCAEGSITCETCGKPLF